MPSVTISQARRAKTQVKELVAEEKDVVGIGLTKARAGYAVKVNWRKRPARTGVPRTIDGVPVIHEVVGTIRARAGR
jgi:hypothetical protein